MAPSSAYVGLEMVVAGSRFRGQGFRVVRVKGVRSFGRRVLRFRSCGSLPKLDLPYWRYRPAYGSYEVGLSLQ